MIRKAVDENVMIELSDPTTGGASGYWHRAATWYSGNGQWQKVVFDFSTHDYFNDPGVVAITAQTADVSGSQDVYIDNVMVEDLPYANGMKLSEVPFGSLSGAITLTGLWMHGKCSKVVDNTWTEFTYDDFELLASKLTPGVTSVDMRGADVRGAYNVFAGINPNMLIYANAWLDNTIPVADAFNTTRFVETKEYSSMPTYFTPQRVQGVVSEGQDCHIRRNIPPHPYGQVERPQQFCRGHRDIVLRRCQLTGGSPWYRMHAIR